MREIKFRVPHYRTDTGEFDHFSYWGRGIHGSEFCSPSNTNFTTPKGDEQLTGIKDSEGVEVYEGDWVEFTYWWFDGSERETSLSGEVVYLPELLSFALKGVKNKEWCQHVGGEDTSAFAFWRFEGDDFHVRGNIHQNPELLK
jgi:uncharacterized phage protein (TIGR01671 family)